LSNNLAEVEKSYLDVTSAEVTAKVFEHWGFDSEFVNMIKYSDFPQSAPDDVKEYSLALNIVKTIVPVNKPFSNQAINFGLKKAKDSGYDCDLLEDVINKIIDKIEGD
jgi:HD-like signal output (HDOD) protein